jgi:Fe-S-cluster containining protein
MLLSKKDIRCLENRGFRQRHFVVYDRQGYATLKNREGYCVFYDQKNRQCSVYDDRPSGCRVYPVIVDEEVGVIVDSICQSKNTVTPKEIGVMGQRVSKLLETIDSEASERRSKES